MLYIVGDSNAVRTAPFLLAPRVDAKTLCREGWTSEEVLRAVNRSAADDLADASAFFVFAGMNDAMLAGEASAAQLLQIVAALRARRPSARVPIFVAPPFCVEPATPPALCAHRQKAHRVLRRELGDLADAVVAVHATQQGLLKRGFRTTKPGSRQWDPLHLNAVGYKTIATVLNEAHRGATSTAKRASPPKRRFAVDG
jgi:lysophospholipase L1-like esterase